MANRGTSTFEEFRNEVQQLAAATLAYHLASDEEKSAIKILFNSVAEYVHNQEPLPERQAVYSKTLLGVTGAKAIERWVEANRPVLLTLGTNDDWLATVWSIFAEQSDDKFFHSVEPVSLPMVLARHWLEGSPYWSLFEYARSQEGTKPWGANNRRHVTDDDIVDFCESTLGFDCTLVLAAVAQFLFGQSEIHDDAITALTLFQKSLKYGLPDSLSISCYERGFSDRVVAQRLREAVQGEGFSGLFIGPALTPHREIIAAVLADYPSYFESVLAGIA